jgi:hypothetical protein
MKFLQRVADLLGAVVKSAKGTHADCEENEGPVFFAKGVIESLAGKKEDEIYSEEKDVLPSFTEDFPFMRELATRSSNLFLDFQSDLPRKTYFGVGNDMEMDLKKLSDLKGIRKHMQDLIFEDTTNKKETRFLVNSRHDPCAETIKVILPKKLFGSKYRERRPCLQPAVERRLTICDAMQVWRTALVILDMHNDHVLDQEPSHAWREIRNILDEDAKASKDKVSSAVREFDPADPKTLSNRTTDARFVLAAGLSKHIKFLSLAREGPVQILVLQWIVLCIWIRTLAKGQGLQGALDMLDGEV